MRGKSVIWVAGAVGFVIGALMYTPPDQTDHVLAEKIGAGFVTFLLGLALGALFYLTGNFLGKKK